jgi:hypothetical protein
MKKLLAALMLIPSLAYGAAGVWSLLGAPIGPYSSKFVCAQAGVTCDAPTLDTEGVQLNGVGGVVVTVCGTATSTTLSGAGTLTAYVYNEGTSSWAPAPDYNLTVTSSAVRCQSFAPFWVADQHGRIAWVTTTVTASANSLTVFVYASAPGGSPL